MYMLFSNAVLSILNLKVKLTDLVYTYLNIGLNFIVSFSIRESRVRGYDLGSTCLVMPWYRTCG